ncbi:hypothetical protein DFH06DRAFT_106326 [Mycena polygramma]|nr:hypothetical protein DFH06DRAFT_106326 [Mycena polygramma]
MKNKPDSRKDEQRTASSREGSREDWGGRGRLHRRRFNLVAINRRSLPRRSPIYAGRSRIRARRTMRPRHARPVQASSSTAASSIAIGGRQLPTSHLKDALRIHHYPNRRPPLIALHKNPDASVALVGPPCSPSPTQAAIAQSLLLEPLPIPDLFVPVHTLDLDPLSVVFVLSRVGSGRVYANSRVTATKFGRSCFSQNTGLKIFTALLRPPFHRTLKAVVTLKRCACLASSQEVYGRKAPAIVSTRMRHTCALTVSHCFTSNVFPLRWTSRSPAPAEAPPDARAHRGAAMPYPTELERKVLSAR